MKKITFLFLLLTVSFGYSQSSPITFESSVTVGGNWNNETGIVTSIVDVSDASITGGATATPASPAGMVGKMITDETKNPWQEAHLNMTTSAIDLTTANGGAKTVTVDVYSTTGNDFLLKVINPVGGGDAFSQVAAAHDGTGWEQLTFDFKNASNSAVPDALFKTFVFFPLYDASATGFLTSQNTTTAIDNIVFVEGSLVAAPSCSDGEQNQGESGIDCGGPCAACPEPPAAPTVAAPTPPARDAANVLSIFSDAYGDVTVDDFDFGLCTASGATDVNIAGNATKNYFSPVGPSGCQGISLETNRLDASAFTNLHVDFYTDKELDGAVFNIKLVDWNGKPTEATATGLELNFNKGTSPSLVPGAWISVDFDLTSLGGVVGGNLTRSDIAQIHITSNLSSAWYDNLYLYKQTFLPGTCSDGEQNQDETGIDCGGVCAPCTGPPSVAAPTPPNRAAADVISIFSDAYTDTAIDDFDFGLCANSGATEVMIVGNPTQSYFSPVSNAGCQGIDLQNNRIDASTFTNLHVDFFTNLELDGVVFNIKLVDWNGNTTEAGSTGLELNFNKGTPVSLVPGKWISLDFDLTTAGAMVGGNLTRSDIAQIHITSNLSEAYYDNLYMYKATPLSIDKNNLLDISLSPSPARNELKISAQNTIQAASIYNVLGKEVKSFSVNAKTKSLDVSNLSTGIYILKYTVDNRVGSMKFIKE